MEFSGLQIDGYWISKFKSMHITILDLVIAEQYILTHKHIFSNGNVAVDQSHGRYELKIKNSENALEGIEYLVKY